jgi:hypothetical protein
MKVILCIQLLFVVHGCTMHQEEQKLLQGYVQQEFAIEELPRAILVISDEGCPVCNRAFLDAIGRHTSTRNTLFLVQAVGLSMDMGAFIKETPNVRFDDGQFAQLGILKGSGMILTHNGEVDEVLQISAQGLEGQLHRINHVLDSLAKSETD